jgi:hypothetical protein
MNKVGLGVAALLESLCVLQPRAAGAEDGWVRLFAQDDVPRGWTVRECHDLTKEVPATPWAVNNGVLRSGYRRGTKDKPAASLKGTYAPYGSRPRAFSSQVRASKNSLSVGRM